MTDEQPPRVKEEKVSLVVLGTDEHVALTRCIQALRELPFPAAMAIMANVICQASYYQGVQRETVMQLVANVWDSMVALKVDPKERV